MKHAVASLADAWIEMTPNSARWAISKSHPSRMRGLKSALVDWSSQNVQVASLADAWIEILLAVMGI